jgi:ArsR family transcriptional regulator, arsenate/arsenite/antimonite-responsive transcriptional repressor
MNAQHAVDALGAIAQESRLAIFRLLVKRGPQGYAAGQIAERLGIAGPTLSFHLKSLEHARLVLARRDGRFLYYSANFERMNDLVAYLTENCCGMADTSCSPACPPALVNTSRKSA